jgi:hypothetical protein
MFDDYVRAFKQFMLYRIYLQGGPTVHGPDKNELLLKRAQGLSYPTKLMAVVANYTFGSLSQISFRNSREKRCSGLLHNLLIVLQVKTKIPIILIV